MDEFGSGGSSLGWSGVTPPREIVDTPEPGSPQCGDDLTESPSQALSPIFHKRDHSHFHDAVNAPVVHGVVPDVKDGGVVPYDVSGGMVPHAASGGVVLVPLTQIPQVCMKKDQTQSVTESPPCKKSRIDCGFADVVNNNEVCTNVMETLIGEEEDDLVPALPLTFHTKADLLWKLKKAAVLPTQFDIASKIPCLDEELSKRQVRIKAEESEIASNTEDT